MQDYALTDVGRVRPHNQDYLYSSSAPVGGLENLYLVADGMGGHKAGDFASRFLVEQLVAYFEKNHLENVRTLFEEGIRYANRKLYEKSLSSLDLEGMGTTLVAATIRKNELFVANVGDSRLYLYKNGGLSQITRDHSYVEEMVRLGRMKRGSREYLEKKNLITRAVGTNRTVEADYFQLKLEAGSLVLLCSDGLTNMMTDREIADCLTAGGTLKDKVERLIAGANRNGGRDNIAVVLADPQISEVGVC